MAQSIVHALYDCLEFRYDEHAFWHDQLSKPDSIYPGDNCRVMVEYENKRIYSLISRLSKESIH
jgi:hypothetical protein